MISGTNNLKSTGFPELKKLIYRRGLMDRQPGYYLPKIVFNLSLLAVSIGLLTIIDGFLLHIANAVFFTFAFGQIAFLGHDAGHLQIFSSNRKNERIGLFLSFLLGVDRTWWVTKHNQHHAYPNNLDLDPDADLPVIGFTKEQVLKKTGILRLIVKYQAYLFFPMLCFEGIGLRIGGTLFLFRNKGKYPWIEPFLLVLHFAAYFFVIFYFLSIWHGIVFIVVHQALFGLYMGSVFAPNHKGMLTLKKNTKLDFLDQQVLTSRNIKASRFTDFLYGGLNYQIEHHLFPSMPRNNLKKAQVIVRDFCNKKGISYYETSMVNSHKEILRHLHTASSPLRA